MKKYISFALFIFATSFAAMAKSSALDFKAQGTSRELTTLDGTVVPYTAYTDITYVTNAGEREMPRISFLVPKGATQKSPILLRAGMYDDPLLPSVLDVSARALQEGMCVCLMGEGSLIDLKAVVRYLRYNDKRMLGSAEKIVVNNSMERGSDAVVLGLSGNHPDYEDALRRMGAAKARDHVFAVVCYSPGFGSHHDEALQWLFSGKSDYESFIEGLAMRHPVTGTFITRENYMDYLKSYIVASAQRFINEGGEIPDTLGFEFLRYMPPTPKSFPGGPRYVRAKAIKTDRVADVDMQVFLRFVEQQRSGLVVMQVKGSQPTDFRSCLTDKRVAVAPHWYIRHGLLDAEEPYCKSVNLATLLMNAGKDVNFSLPWNRHHAENYDLDGLFRWLRSL